VFFFVSFELISSVGEKSAALQEAMPPKEDAAEVTPDLYPQFSC
jgi:hypothetical protein